MELNKKLQRILENENLTKGKKAEEIKKYFKQERMFFDLKLWMYLLKLFAGELLILISSVFPASMSGKLSYAALENLLTKNIGRKIAKSVSNNVSTGVVSGSILGAGEGLSNDKNVGLTTIEDGILLGLYGGILGSTTSYIERYLRGIKLKSFGDIDKLSRELRKKYFKSAKKFYKDYIQDIVIYKDGKIIFSKRGVLEVLKWNPKKAQYFPELVNDLKNAQFNHTGPNIEPKKAGKVKSYDVYIGKYGSYKIENLSDNVTRRYYFTNDRFTSGDTATSRSHSKTTIQEFTNSGKSVGTYRDSNYIINDNSENFNPNFTNYDQNNTNIPTGNAADLRDYSTKNPNEERSISSDILAPQVPQWSSEVLENGDRVYRTQYANPDYGFPVTWEIREKKKKYPPSYFELYEVVEDIVVSLLDDFIRFMGYDEVHKL